ncbi:hypothetical protein [Hymenobacter sp. BRD67]|uniref:hypothetical protein n=1 Tax=Hymenobacter sp. BRD67 TaxID=2675877 RepID=UPI0015677CA7|nr:hypothetical protein [Hymenobacter sp. BRD67]QKG53509.1 hypothetical protein GKZ67_14030 [Hymenobacter sp. BRD67]
MQNLTSTLGRLAVVLTSALALGSCSRAEYSFQSHAPSYLGTTTAPPKARLAVASSIETPAAAPAAEAATTVATPNQEDIAAVKPAPASTPPVASVPVAKAKAHVAEAAAVATAPEAVATKAAPKLNLVQRLALNKVMRKLDKQTQKITARQGNNTASTTRGAINGNLKIGLVLLLIGLLLSLINGLIGTIVAIIGLIFIVLWLLDQV